VHTHARVYERDGMRTVQATALVLAFLVASALTQSDEAVVSFKRWIATHNVSCDALEWPVETPFGRGAVAARRVEPGEAICAVPPSLMLTSLRFDSNSTWSAINGLPLNDKGEVEGKVKATLVLLREVELGAQSFWAPYIGVLPKDPVTSIDDDAQAAEFQDDHLVRTLRSQDSQMREQGRVVRHALDQIKGNPYSAEAYSVDKYYWARQIVESRVYGVHVDAKRPEVIALIPMLDLLNHNSDGNWYTIAVDSRSPVPDPWLFSGMCKTFSRVAVEPGAEVFNSYQPEDNWDLLIKYRFAEINNTHDAARILDVDTNEVHVLPSDMNEDNLKEWCLQAFDATGVGEADVINKCINVVDTALAAMPTTLAHDLELMQSRGPTTALVYRTQRKAILIKHAEQLRKLLSRLARVVDT